MNYALCRFLMLETALEKFPVRATLQDGSPCSVRPMEAGDESAFCAFHTAIPEEEQLFVRSEIKDGALFHRWMDGGEFTGHLPLLAFIDGTLAAMGTLQLRPGGWKRHIGEIFFLTHPDHRGIGLIDLVMDELIEAARHCGLTRLESELNAERRSALEAMSAAGFEELVRLPDYVLDMKAQPHDYVLMGRRLVPSHENLGAGD